MGKGSGQEIGLLRELPMTAAASFIHPNAGKSFDG